MHSLIVLAHPEPRSFNGHLRDVAAATLGALGHAVEHSDLCAMSFDPVEGPRHYRSRGLPERFDAQTEQRHAAERRLLPADVQGEIAKLERARFLLLQFPMWWFSVPAVLKGWFDRVLVYGGLYSSTMRYDKGYFRGRRAMLSVTTGGPEPTFAHNGRNGDIELLLWPTHMTLSYMGYTVLPPFVAYEVGGGIQYSEADEGTRRNQAYARALEARLRPLDLVEPLKFNGWVDWDERGRLRPGVPGHSPFMRAEP